MIESRSQVTLKSGEVVDFTVVSGPDKKWQNRIEALFAHKGDPWRWQNRQFLGADLGFDRRYYILHRNETPFAGMLISEFGGVGVLNHVWTKPEDRGEGASSSLMRHLMKGFEVRQGKMMVLHTGYGSIAYSMYKKLGFDSIEPKSKYMHWHSDTEMAFYRDYFAESRTSIKPISWTHWVAIQPLFQGDFGDVVRCTALGHLGRRCTEAEFLSFLRDEQARQLTHEQPRAFVLQSDLTNAVVGFIMWEWHPLWTNTCLVDLFCHPSYWNRAGELLATLQLPMADRHIAFSDSNNTVKQNALEGAGFKQVAVLKSWAAKDYLRTSFVDVALFQQ